jgi:hypothetical protein
MAMNPTLGLRGVIRPYLNAYYDIYQKVASDMNLTFIDHRPDWARMPHDMLVRALPDGSHPVVEIARDIIVPNVRRALFPDCSPADAAGMQQPAPSTRPD